MTRYSDCYLVEMMKTGDKTALGIIYKKYYTGLYYYAKKHVGNNFAAKDIVQDSFLKIWENRNSIAIESSFSSYLYKSVYNNSLNYLKQKQIIDKHLTLYKEQIEIAKDYFAISQENGQSILMAKEFGGQIDQAIENLPEKCRQIFKLSRFEGLKNHEIASELVVSINTVQTQISIAIKKLRADLEIYISESIPQSDLCYK